MERLQLQHGRIIWLRGRQGRRGGSLLQPREDGGVPDEAAEGDHRVLQDVGLVCRGVK